MKARIFILSLACLAAALSLGITTPAQALTFYLDAWDTDGLPNYVGVPGLEFTVTCYNEFDEIVFQDVMDYPGGGLYQCYLTEQEAEELENDGAVTWDIVCTEPGGWVPDTPPGGISFEQEIDWGGNNPCDPRNWWFHWGQWR